MDGLDKEALGLLLASLGRDCRYAVLMYYADDLTAQEIALVLDRPACSIERWLQAFRVEASCLLTVSIA